MGENDAALVEQVAERLSWDDGEFTRWAEDAHDDHNRWSWRGDGHPEAMRAEYRERARAVVAIVLEGRESTHNRDLRAVRAEAAAEGHSGASDAYSGVIRDREDA